MQKMGRGTAARSGARCVRDCCTGAERRKLGMVGEFSGPFAQYGQQILAPA